MISGFEAGRYRIFGETLDIAVGNCLDSFAREAGLEYPGGPAIEKMAEKGDELHSLPYIVKGMDLSFSGIATSIINLLRSGDHEVADLCYSLQETAFAMLGEVTERALAHTGKPEILLTGGVGANKRLRSIVKTIAEEHGSNSYFVPIQYATDNGAKIAWTGLIAYQAGVTTPIESSFIDTKWRINQVEIPWR